MPEVRRTRTLGGVFLNLTLDLALDLDLDLRGLRADLPVDLDLAVELGGCRASLARSRDGSGRLDTHV